MEAKSLALSLLLMLVAPAAWADTPGWYLGLSLGQSDYSSVADDATSQNGPCFLCQNDNATGIGFTMLGGYRFDSHFALEAQAFDLGNGTISSSTFSVSGPSHSNSTRFRAVGYGLDAVGYLPLNGKAELFGKLGLVRTRLDVDTATFFNDPNLPGTPFFSESVSATKTNYELGFGIQAPISPRWDLRFGFTQIHNVGESDPNKGTFVGLDYTGKGNVNFIYAMALLRF